MLNKFVVLSVLILVFSGCKTDPKLRQELDELKKDVDSLKQKVGTFEKMLMPPKEDAAVQAQAYDVPIDGSPVFGKADAKVHLTVFSNFQCPYCAKADKSLREALKDPELSQKANMVFKNFPFERHTNAKPAAKAALAANEQGKFFEMAEKMFNHQGELGDAKYQKWATELGLNIAKFNKDLKDNDAKYNSMIDRDIKFGSENAKLEGTPWILVNGWLFEGDINAENIKKLIANKHL